MDKEYVSLRFKNKMYVIEKLLQESHDKAIARIWFIAKKSHDNPKMTHKQLVCLSHMHVNEKYMQMKY